VKSLDVQKYRLPLFIIQKKQPMFLIQIDFDELEQKLNKLENDCRAAFDYLRAISKHETAQIKTKYV